MTSGIHAKWYTRMDWCTRSCHHEVINYNLQQPYLENVYRHTRHLRGTVTVKHFKKFNKSQNLHFNSFPFFFLVV